MKKKQIIEEPFEEFNENEIDDITDQGFRSVLGKGLFWFIKGVDGESYILNFKMACFRDGVTVEEVESGFCATDGISHKAAWEKLKKDQNTKNKPYNYFPRGRVQIKKGVATIYLTPELSHENFIQGLIASFGLTAENGISKIKVRPDYSKHYKFLMEI
jgi:hypothetical protein